MNEKCKIKNEAWREFEGWRSGLGSGGWGLGGGKLQASKLQHPEKFQVSNLQAPICRGGGPVVLADGHQPGGAGDKTSKLRNKANLKMHESPDFKGESGYFDEKNEPK